jgi:hypothetical protein
MEKSPTEKMTARKPAQSDSVVLPVDPQDIHQIYQELADDVRMREQALADEVPVDATAKLAALLEQVVTDWESGRKSLRAVPVLTVYQNHLDEPVSDDIKCLLTGLDALINVLDDIVDTPDAPTKLRIRLAFNAAIAPPLFWRHVPPVHTDELGDLLMQYLVEVFQIPLVENKLLDRFQAADSRRQRLQTARELYAYRARVIGAFAKIPAVVHDVDAETTSRIVGDLCAFRARQLLFKDIHDVERDVRDDDETPVSWLLEHEFEMAMITSFISDLYGEFSYSEAGREAYGELLYLLEGHPEDVEQLLVEQQE